MKVGVEAEPCEAKRHALPVAAGIKLTGEACPWILPDYYEVEFTDVEPLTFLYRHDQGLVDEWIDVVVGIPLEIQLSGE